MSKNEISTYSNINLYDDKYNLIDSCKYNELIDGTKNNHNKELYKNFVHQLFISRGVKVNFIEK